MCSPKSCTICSDMRRRKSAEKSSCATTSERPVPGLAGDVTTAEKNLRRSRRFKKRTFSRFSQSLNNRVSSRKSRFGSRPAGASQKRFIFSATCAVKRSEKLAKQTERLYISCQWIDFLQPPAWPALPDVFDFGNHFHNGEYCPSPPATVALPFPFCESDPAEIFHNNRESPEIL